MVEVALVGRGEREGGREGGKGGGRRRGRGGILELILMVP